jgi:mycothiol synthase
MALQVTRGERLDEAARASVRALASAVEAEIGEPPLSDQALTQLAGARAEHTLVHHGDDLVGYAQLVDTSLEMVGDGQVVDALLDALEPLPAGVQIWSHGKRSPIGPALEQRGYTTVRTLHKMRRPLEPLPPEEPLPDGVTVRSFVPGQDEDAWLAVNAAAFAALRDQAGWQREDILARENEAWFDPAGFLLAERDGELLGFHWTKVHTADLGEVYVLGIGPAAQGMRLGAALLQRGLAYLAGRGCRDVMLYVDDANAGALRLYERTGFSEVDRDTLWTNTSA